jgi:uncharacterized protein (TIGR02246 family)
MAASSPQDLPQMYLDAFNAHDVDAVLALYEADAIFAPSPDQQVSGAAAIQEALNGFFALNPRMEGQIKRVFEAGDVALVLLGWRLTGTGPDGQAVELTDTSSDVFRRQEDGTWLVAVDNPWTSA